MLYVYVVHVVYRQVTLMNYILERAYIFSCCFSSDYPDNMWCCAVQNTCGLSIKKYLWNFGRSLHAIIKFECACLMVKLLNYFWETFGTSVYFGMPFVFELSASKVWWNTCAHFACYGKSHKALMLISVYKQQKNLFLS